MDNIHHSQNEHNFDEVLRDFFDDENVNHFVNDYMCLINDPKNQSYSFEYKFKIFTFRKLSFRSFKSLRYLSAR